MRAQLLAQEFREEFEVVVADSEPLREAAFRLRHEVYCLELGMEPLRLDGLERDAYDERALHYLLRHVPSGVWAGCVRLVLDDGRGLPYEQIVPVDGPPGPVGEISRLTVARVFRQAVRVLPSGPPFPPHAVLGLALTALAAAVEARLESAVCVMTQRLERQLRVYGIRFAQLSDEIEYRGRRALFRMAPQVTYREVEPDLQGVLSLVRDQVRGVH